MRKLTKNRKQISQKYDRNKAYPLSEAAKIVKEISSYSRFDSSIDIAVRLGIDPRKSNQMVRGVVKLPHSTGKNICILALVGPDKEVEAKEAGADYVGSDEYIEKINHGWTEIDVIITTPMMMPKLGRLGKILGPRGLMPNPKTGTISTEIGKSIKEVKSGKIDFKVDRFGIVHATVGRASFLPEKVVDNSLELIKIINRLKPSSSSGTYLKSIFLSGTMSPGIQIDVKSII
ncbi:50S ribosomal protein L1 [Candidatus Walczuchella monophlebidarum]|uniref:Large ribosomal subunit protein uL1 n=1 Tax=Candidatus Walczuchella monophlebidarum TaxID=1415657 RepID=A0A068DS37_9FLAO|nr:50S ribosomal protein L1 [Candidatus Walczuchella monophlebidarum]AID37441.1 ribosomal protein L1 [Candidatus Walczuchella monophlebidarum]